MNNLIIYLLQVSAGSILLYACFILFYRNDTFYLRNRVLLILSIVLPVLIPLINLSVKNVSDSSVVPRNVIDNILVTGISLNESVSGRLSALNISDIIVWFWVAVAFALIIRIFSGIIRTCIIIRNSEMIGNGKMKIVVSDLNHPPFSFYPFAVIPRTVYEQDNNNEVIAHEEVHIHQMHTLDLLLSELFIAIFWFNPVAWLIKKSIILNHEYLADNEIIHKTVNIREYQYRLLNIPAGLRSIPLANNFSSNIKSRLIMMNKRPTNNFASMKNTLILPVVAILLIMFSFKPEPELSKSSFQNTPFSKTSLSEIYNFIYKNINYPQEAKATTDSGKVFVVIKMGKGGKIRKSQAFNENDGITVPILDEVVIVAYRPGSGQGATNINNRTKGLHIALKAECLRVAKKMGSLAIPEWQDKNVEFALAFSFNLR